MEIKKLDLQDRQTLESAFAIIKQLRKHLNFESFCDLVNIMVGENYELWAAVDNHRLAGVVSTRVYTDLVRGTHMYVDDLVVDESQRSKGLGALLLNHVEIISKSLQCKSLRLCCAMENVGGVKFYKREGWHERSIALVKR